VIQETLHEAVEKMDKAVEVAKEDFATVRTGRANPALFSKVTVDYYGTPTPLQQRDSDIGANPANDGNVIRVVLPELTEERRKEYVKVVRGKAEDAKVSIRNIRRRAMDTIGKLVKDGDIGEDEGSRAEKDLDAKTKSHTDNVDELLKRKEAELLEV
jgi:ribosome recycling factor